MNATSAVGLGEPNPFAKRENRAIFELHRRVARKLATDPNSVLTSIPRGVDLIRPNARGVLVTQWLDEWIALFAGSIDELMSILRGSDEQSYTAGEGH